MTRCRPPARATPGPTGADRVAGPVESAEGTTDDESGWGTEFGRRFEVPGCLVERLRPTVTVQNDPGAEVAGDDDAFAVQYAADLVYAYGVDGVGGNGDRRDAGCVGQ